MTLISRADPGRGQTLAARRPFPAVGPWLWVALGTGLFLLGAFALDQPIERRVVDPSSSVGNWLAEAFSETARGHWPLGVAALVWVIGWWRRTRDWQRVALILLLSTALAGVSAVAIRSVTGRTRPGNPEAEGWFGPYHNGKWLIGRYAYNSFPSGHVATAAGFAFALTLTCPRFGWVALAWLLAVGWSRVQSQSHHFSDVCAAICLGGWCALAVWRLFERRRSDAGVGHRGLAPPPDRG